MDPIELGIERADLLPTSWPTAPIVMLAVVATVAWIGSHLVARRWLSDGPRWLLLPGFVLRWAIGFVALLSWCTVLSRCLLLGSSWSIWLLCLVTAFSVEAIVVLYRLERQIVSRGAGLALLSLRTALVLLVALMLVQPVLSWSFSRTNERYVAILLDDSASMQIVDRQLTDSEKLRLADVFAPSVAKRPYDLDAATAELTPWIDRLGGEAVALYKLADAAPDLRKQQFGLHSIALKDKIKQLRQLAVKHAARLEDVLDSGALTLKNETRETAGQLRDQLGGALTSRLLEAEKLLAVGDEDLGRRSRLLADHLNGAAAELRTVTNRWPGLVNQLDRAFIASLPPEKVEQLNKATERSREDIARTLLLGDDDQMDGLLGQMDGEHTVRIFRFAGEAAELDAEAWRAGDVSVNQTANKTNDDTDQAASVDDQGSDADPGATDPDSADEATGDPSVEDPPGQLDGQPIETGPNQADRMTTDLAGALATVRETIPAKNLAGVVVLSDGRHNAQGDAEAMATRLAAQDALTVSTIALGSSRPPVDAAILEVDNPKTLFIEDRLTVKTRIKLTGMRGREVRVKLVSDEATIAEQIVPVPTDDLMTTVQLSDTPADEGVRRYAVLLEPIEADAVESSAFADNVRREVTVAVTDQRTQVLLIEGRPRWEFRYIRNLLAARDKTVQLQTVLLKPDRVASSGELPKIHASVTRPLGDTEATMLPSSESEWLKFNVVILGDLSPSDLKPEDLEAIEAFVTQRGGTLIVIAGQHQMPHAFADTPLADLLPVTFAASTGSIMAGPESQFRFALTEVGRRHAVLQQMDDADANVEFWKSLPEMHWRHPILDTKPGATVLAYASNDKLEKELSPKEGQPDDVAEAQLKRRTEVERKNALIVVQSVGAGRVMMMTTDRTWRLRYRTGDTHHHRLWGQVLRWAEADKLQAGTELVRLGTDRILYEHDQPVIIRAQITDSYHAPVADENAMVKVYRDEQLVMRQRLNLLPESGGRYEITLGRMPGPGQYRLELESPEAKKILVGEEAGDVKTRITVLPPEADTRELVEVTTDRAALARLARAGGGTNAEVSRASTVLDFFASGTEHYTEAERFRLWDSWPLLVLILLVLTAEWMLRKKVGLT